MPWFVAPILAPIAGLAVKTVFNNLVPKFSEGTVLSGKTHPEGGIPLYSPSGGFYGEAEDKETILTAGVSENPQLMDIASRINVLGGGKTLSNNSGFFAEGGSLAKQPIVYQPVLILNDVNDLNEMQRKIDVMQKF